MKNIFGILVFASAMCAMTACSSSSSKENEIPQEEGMEEDYFAVNEEFDLDVANETLIENS